MGQSEQLYFFVLVPTSRQSQGGLDRDSLGGRLKDPIWLITASVPFVLPARDHSAGQAVLWRPLKEWQEHPFLIPCFCGAMLQENKRALAW